MTTHTHPKGTKRERCETCRHWCIKKPLDKTGTCDISIGRKRANDTCSSWIPVFREIGEIRKSFTSDYREFLRLAAVRRLFARGCITYEQVIPLATRGYSKKIAEGMNRCISLWPEAKS